MISKKNTFIFGFISIFLIFTTACNKDQPKSKTQHHATSSSKAQQLILEFKTEPQQPLANKPVNLVAIVKENKHLVKNAKVKLEIWKKGSKKHHTITAKSDQKGQYIVKNTYKEKGVYVVIMHVTTPQVHQMMNSTFRINEKLK